MKMQEKTSAEELKEIEGFINEHKQKDKKLRDRMINTFISMILLLLLIIFVYFKTDLINLYVSVVFFIIWTAIFRMLYIKNNNNMLINRAGLILMMSAKESCLEKEFGIMDFKIFQEFKDFILNKV